MQAYRCKREWSRSGSWLQRRSQSCRCFQDPVAIPCKRYDAAHESTAGFAVGPRLPAHDSDQRPISFVEHRAAGIAVTDPEPGSLAEFPRIDQRELLGRGPVGRYKSAARSLPAVLRSPCTPTPKPATMKRSPTDGGARRSLNTTRV